MKPKDIAQLVKSISGETDIVHREDNNKELDRTRVNQL